MRPLENISTPQTNDCEFSFSADFIAARNMQRQLRLHARNGCLALYNLLGQRIQVCLRKWQCWWVGLAEYFFRDNGNAWQPDLSRSNHFLYDESISATYASVDAEKGKWHWQAGLRYEYTSYKARQLGNALVKDSAFKKTMAVYFLQPLRLIK